MKVLVAMSGGVDSSVAASLLREAGHDVTGVTLRLWGGHSDSGCCSVADVEDARRVAAQLGIAHYVFDFADEFDAAVVAPYAEAYAAGRTPNPCVECNRSMKFGRLLDRALVLGYDAVATGHHARRIVGPDGTWRLARGRDAAKDQSYVLYMLGARELARLLLPVGELTKAEVRTHAAARGLRTATKAESMDVCFVARRDRADFVRARVPTAPGAIVDVDGLTLGRHDGIERFTIGQRRGVAIGGGDRRYVVDIVPSTATVTIGPRDALLRDDVRVRQMTFVAGRPDRSTWLGVQARAHGEVIEGRLDGDVVRFAEPQVRVAPGQVVALYDGDELVGGGIAG